MSFIQNFSINGSSHQKIFRNRNNIPAENNVPQPTSSNFPDRLHNVFSAPQGFWSTVAWPVVTSWKFLGFTAAEAFGKIPSAVMGTVNATRWSIGNIFGSQKTGTEGLVPNVAKRGYRFIKRGTWDAAGAPVVNATRATAYNALNWAAHVPADVLKLPKAAFGAFEGIRLKLIHILGDVVEPVFKALKMNKIIDYTDRVGILANDYGKAILDPFRNTASALGREYDIAFDAVLDAPRGLTTAYTGAIHEPWTSGVNDSFRKVANEPDIFAAMGASRDTMNGWLKTFLRPKHLRGGDMEMAAV